MKRFAISTAVVALMLMGLGGDAQAGGLLHGLFGSHGSSGGSHGSSGGSYGSSGGASYGSSGGSYGSSGGSSGGLTHRQERLIYRAARRSASSGSAGSSGGSYGSTGSSGGSYGSHGSSGGSSGGLSRRSLRKVYRSASHGSSGSHGSSSYGSHGSSSYGSSYGGSYGATSTYGHRSAGYAVAAPSVSAYQRQYVASAPAPVQHVVRRPAQQQVVVKSAAVQPQRTFVAAAPTPATTGYAYVVVQLPEDAKLYLGGNATHVAGGLRKFKIPVTNASKSYSYAIRAELTRNGQVYVAKSTETLVAGKTVSVKVNDVAANVNVAAR